MGDVVNLDSLRQCPPQWGAAVTIDPDGAEITGFWGHDGLEADERCLAYAERLEALARQLRETSEALSEPRP